MRRFQRGMTLVELILMGIIVMLVLAVGFRGLVSLKIGFEQNMDTNGATGDARQAMVTLGDHLRSAVRCTATSGCVKDSAIASGDATSITYYTAPTGSPVTYLLTGGNLVRRVSGVDTVVVRRVSALTISYLTGTGYNGAGWTSIASSSPTSTELLQLCAVRVVMTTQQNGTSSTIESVFRLRNSPKKGPLVGY